MKCPYKKTYIKTEGWSQGYDENGNATHGLNCNSSTELWADCLEKDCAAYSDGVCNYKER